MHNGSTQSRGDLLVDISLHSIKFCLPRLRRHVSSHIIFRSPEEKTVSSYRNQVPYMMLKIDEHQSLLEKEIQHEQPSSYSPGLLHCDSARIHDGHSYAIHPVLTREGPLQSIIENSANGLTSYSIELEQSKEKLTVQRPHNLPPQTKNTLSLDKLFGSTTQTTAT